MRRGDKVQGGRWRRVRDGTCGLLGVGKVHLLPPRQELRLEKPAPTSDIFP